MQGILKRTAPCCYSTRQQPLLARSTSPLHRLRWAPLRDALPSRHQQQQQAHRDDLPQQQRRQVQTAATASGAAAGPAPPEGWQAPMKPIIVTRQDDAQQKLQFKPGLDAKVIAEEVSKLWGQGLIIDAADIVVTEEEEDLPAGEYTFHPATQPPAVQPAKMVRRPTESPSSFSKYSVWQRAQEEANSPFLVPFLDYRTQDSEPPMPITLVDQVLARIREAFSGKGQHSAAPTPAELSTVAGLTRMAGHFASEDERRDVFLLIMNAYLGGDGQLAVNNIDKYSTDGTLLVGGSEGMPIVILEVKNKVGESGDPGPQGEDFYRRYLLDRAHKPGTAKTVHDTPCPCLLLELMGPELRVSAMASTCDIQVFCQPLIPRLHLYDMFASDWEHMLAVAKGLQAIKFGVAELRDYYASADASSDRPAKRYRPSAAPNAANQLGLPLQRNPSLQLPYPLRPDSGYITSVKLPEPLLPPRQGCLLYRIWPAADAQSRLVKFVQRGSYGEAVHRAWAEQGLAPALYGVQQLPGGLCMVQMEELGRSEGWRPVAEIPVAERTEDLYAAVVGALRRAFTVEFGNGKRGVHGDARAANVLVKGRLTAAAGSLPHVQEQQGTSGEEGEHQRPSPSSSSQPGVDVAPQQGPAATGIEVRFVDFDWAGIVGEAELPLWAVPRRGLPPDRKLTTDYDLAALHDTWQLDFTTGVIQGES